MANVWTKLVKIKRILNHILIIHEFFAHEYKVKGPTYIKMLEYCECLYLVYLY